MPKQRKPRAERTAAASAVLEQDLSKFLGVNTIPTYKLRPVSRPVGTGTALTDTAIIRDALARATPPADAQHPSWRAYAEAATAVAADRIHADHVRQT